MKTRRSDMIKKGFDRAPHRSLLRAAGVKEEDFDKPFIAVVNSYIDIIPGHVHLQEFGKIVKEAIREAGGVPFEMNTIGVDDGIAMGHIGMRYSLPSREIIADSIETVVSAHWFDGMVCIPNCDKITPGMMMAAMRLNIPTIFVSGGPMKAGVTKDGRKISLSSVFEGVGAYLGGSLDEKGTMLRPHQEDGRYTETTVKLDDLVPEDHLVRKLDAAIDFSFIYDVVKDLYSPDHGRPSIDPVMLFKMYLIQYVFGIRSMRETVEQIRTNVAYRWFLGLSLHDPVPHHSTPSKNYARRFAGTDVFHQIFSRILKEAFEHGLVDSSVLYVDSTHVKASANKKKFTTEMAEVEAKAYQQELEKEIERDRIAHGKSPLPSEKKKKREVKVSKTDPESGLLVKNERERVFAYSYHTACDRNGWILQTYVTAANVHDSQAFFVLFERVKREIQSCPEAVCVDAGYKTPAIAKYLLEQGVKPIWPYTRPKTKDGFFRKSDFVYDEYFDCYLCPNDQVLSYSTTNREGYREYKSDPAVCRSCPYLHQCTQSKSYTKVVTRHVWQDYYEEAEHLRYVPEYRELYALRKETIERDFADMKEKHGLRWTHYRGLEKNEAQAMLVCAAMNLKKLANYLWKAKHRPFFSFAWLPILPTFFENIVYLWNKMGFRHSSETHFVNSLKRVSQLVFHHKKFSSLFCPLLLLLNSTERNLLKLS